MQAIAKSRSLTAREAPNWSRKVIPQRLPKLNPLLLKKTSIVILSAWMDICFFLMETLKKAPRGVAGSKAYWAASKKTETVSERLRPHYFSRTFSTWPIFF